jgi:hypothetical protein
MIVGVVATAELRRQSESSELPYFVDDSRDGYFY